MADNLKNKGKRDDVEVSKQYHERKYMLDQYSGLSPQQLSGAIQAVGNNRADIQKYLKEKGVKKK